MEKTIRKGDILEASRNVIECERLKDLFSHYPVLMLLVPMIAIEIQNAIFGEESEDEE